LPSILCIRIKVSTVIARMHVDYRNQKEKKKIKNIRFHRFGVLDTNIFPIVNLNFKNIGRRIETYNYTNQ